ncbi:MAG: flagellar basal body P-ring formation chaperone FlgA [Rhodothermales bacterium]
MRLSLSAFVLLTLLVAAAPALTLQAAAERALAARFPDDAERLRVRVLRTGGDVDAAAPIRVVLPGGAAIPRGHTQVDVLAETPNGWQKTGWALLHVAHYDSVVVARRAVGRGEPVAPADLGTVWTETTTFHGEPLRAADLRALGDDLRADRSLRADRALRRGDLRPPFAADTGDAVTMRYRRGTLTLAVPCHAREPGAVGDEIRLYNATTDATYRARLTAPGEAEWIVTL